MTKPPVTPVASTPPAPSGGGFAGLRGSVAVAILAAAGALGGLGVAVSLHHIDADRSAVLAEELAEREEAGRAALLALREASEAVTASQKAWWEAERRRVEHRASELALLATLQAGSTRRGRLPRSWEAQPGEALGLLDLDADRILEFSGADLTDGATLSTTLPVLAGALQSQPKDRRTPLVVREEGHVWGVGTPFAGSLYLVARVQTERPPPAARPLERAERALGSLAAPTTHPPIPGGSLPYLLGGVLLTALLAGFWASRRWTSPLSETLSAARAFVHGERDVRADEHRGGRDARDVARAVNALIERAERLKAQGRAARTDDVTAAATAIQTLGQGDLRSPAPVLGETFRPIAQAIDDARRGLLERVTKLHDVAAEVAHAAMEYGDAAHAVAIASTEQCDVLKRLGAGADESTRQLGTIQEQVASSLDEVASVAGAHRRSVREVRAALRNVGRKVHDVGANAARVEALIAGTPKIESALALLSDLSQRLAGSDAVDERTRQKVAMASGEARASLTLVQRELNALAQELRTSGEVLSAILAEAPEPPGDVDGRVRSTLTEAVETMRRSAEMSAQGLRALERASRSMAHSGELVEAAARSSDARLPRLSDAFSEIRVGASFEEALLERLERARDETHDTEEITLTTDGQRMVDEVDRASRDARARLTKLIEATEQAAAILRG
ncbi:MAG: hypothetical protein RMA76_41830 [Deltaproteobacteria bacterium]